MDERPQDRRITDFRQHAWEYFHYHASQRLTTFHFYIIICSIVATGYLTAIKDSNTKPLGIILGLLLPFLSFIFWKLDTRNKQMIKNAEAAIRHLEAESALEDVPEKPHVLKVFTFEEAQSRRLREQNSVWPWKRHYTYSRCFGCVFIVLGFLGLMGAVYAATIW